jgi:hypothetical protein
MSFCDASMFLSLAMEPNHAGSFLDIHRGDIDRCSCESDHDRVRPPIYIRSHAAAERPSPLIGGEARQLAS